MKKLMMLVVAGMMVFAFSGCREKTTTEKLKDAAADVQKDVTAAAEEVKKDATAAAEEVKKDATKALDDLKKE